MMEPAHDRDRVAREFTVNDLSLDSPQVAARRAAPAGTILIPIGKLSSFLVLEK
jgi:hypothetical protein